MNSILRNQLAACYESLSEMERRWRDCDGKLYGMGPDCVRKCEAIKTFADAFGWRIVPDEEGNGISFRFDADRAAQLGIPRACWPENAGAYYAPWEPTPQED